MRPAAPLTVCTLLGVCVWCAAEVVSVGGGPRLAPPPSPAVVVAAGQDVTLPCKVLHQGDRIICRNVSWVRSRDVQILSAAGSVFTSDARVSVRGGALRIRALRPDDSGRYECQLNTEPKTSVYYQLTVLDEPVPVVVVSAERREVWGAAGEDASLDCSALWEPPPRALPLPPLHVEWSREGAELSARRAPLSDHSERSASRVHSRLTLRALRPDDAGHYTCSARDAHDTVLLHVTHGEQVEAMQRDAGATGGAGGRAPVWGALLWGAAAAAL